MSTETDTNEEARACEDRIESHMADRMADLRALWAAYNDGAEEVEGLGSIYEYGLSIDYVAPGTFKDQGEGYLRYQLSWGGPSDEFRFFFSPSRNGYTPHRVEYWFLDWFDGAHRVLSGDDLALMVEMFEWWDECGSVEGWIEDATA